MYAHSMLDGSDRAVVTAPFEGMGVDVCVSPDGRSFLCLGDYQDTGEIWRGSMSGGKLKLLTRRGWDADRGVEAR